MRFHYTAFELSNVARRDLATQRNYENNLEVGIRERTVHDL